MPRPGFREEALREAIELLFFAYRDMTAGPDAMPSHTPAYATL